MSYNGNEGGNFIYNGEELEEIPRGVTHVKVHPSVKAVKDWPFLHCTQYTTVNLSEELEEIGNAAFSECTSLYEIVISPAVKVLKQGTFNGCTQLTNVNLGEGIGEN